MHSGRRIQQHLDSNSGFQSDVIMGDNIEFAIPDCYFATTRRPLFRQTQPRLDPSTEFADGQKSGFANLPLFGRRRSDRPNDLGSRSRTSAWTTMIVGFGGLGLTQETGAALRSLTSGSQRVHV
jgi:hypothetical protein